MLYSLDKGNASISFTEKSENENIVRGVSILHASGISEGFLSSLGAPFLELLYQAMADSANVVLIAARAETSAVAGYVSACTNVTEFYKEFRRKYFWKAAPILFKSFFSAKTLRKIFETNRYPDKIRQLSEAELLSIVVAEQYRGTGLAAKLFSALCEEFGKKKVKKFKVVVSKNNKRANRYYRKMGFEMADTVEVHRGEVSNIYIKRLP